MITYQFVHITQQLTVTIHCGFEFTLLGTQTCHSHRYSGTQTGVPAGAGDCGNLAIPDIIFMRTRTIKCKMAAISTSLSVSSSSVVNHYGTNSQSMSARTASSAVTVQVLSSSPATPIVSRGGSVDNGNIWSV